MMVLDKRNELANELIEKFREYVVLDEALDYMEAKLTVNAPPDAVKAHERYIEISKEILKEKEKSPFL